MKKDKVKTPSGRILIRKRKERPAAVKCANCKSPLHGMKRLIPNQLKKLSASEKRPNRPYGGYFCSNCTRELFREQVRMNG